MYRIVIIKYSSVIKCYKTYRSREFHDFSHFNYLLHLHAEIC